MSARDRTYRHAVTGLFAGLAAAALLPTVTASAATGAPLQSPADNSCDRGAAASPPSVAPATRPSASLVLHAGTRATDPAIQPGSVLTAPATLLHDAGGSTVSAGLTVRSPDGYCAWHGDVNSRHHFQPAAETHVYRTPGFYQPWIYVVDSAGVWSEKKLGPLFQVNAPPSPSFRLSPSAPTSGQQVTFTSTSSDFEQDKYGEPISHAWDLDGDGFDDGTGATARFTYRSSKAWVARLQVTDSNGAVRTAEQAVPVAAPATSAPTSRPGTRRPSGSSGSSDPAQAGLPDTETGDPSGMFAVTDEQGATHVFLAPRVLARFSVKRRRTRVRMLALRSLVPGSAVLVRCRGRGCPRRSQSVYARTKTLRFRRFERSLRTGAVLEIVVTKPGTIGRYVRLRMRRGAKPVRRELCVPDGERKPGTC